MEYCGQSALVSDNQLVLKTLRTFPSAYHLLAEIYRHMNLSYSGLLSKLLQAEREHEIILQNEKKRPIGSAPVTTTTQPEVLHANAPTNFHRESRGRGYNRGRGRGRGRGHGFGRGRRQQHDTSERSDGKGKKSKMTKGSCHRCGTDGHWANQCRTPEHLVNLYQESKKKEKPAAYNAEPSVVGYEFMEQPSEFDPEANVIEINSVSATNGDRSLCIIDSGATHTILNKPCYFKHGFKGKNLSIDTLAGPIRGEGIGHAQVELPNKTIINIPDAIYSSKSPRNLLAFRTLRENGYHLMTGEDVGKDVLQLIQHGINGIRYADTFPSMGNKLYSTRIEPVLPIYTVNTAAVSFDDFTCWHRRLGHPGNTMLRKMLKHRVTSDLPAKLERLISDSQKSLCVPCAQGKLIRHPFEYKEPLQSPRFLERLHGDICGPIEPPSGPFRYYMVLVDASSRHSQVTLLSTRNLAFSRLLAQLIRLRVQFPESPVKFLRMDNAREFRSRSFDDYCLSVGIHSEEPVPYEHEQNGLAEAHIKQLQLVARPMLLQSNLPASAWGHAVLHAAQLLKFRPASYLHQSPQQLVSGFPPSVAHLRVFGCAVYVPIPPPKRTKFGPQRQLGIYIGFDSPSKLRYLDHLTGNLFTARFTDCRFDESVFPILGGEKTLPEKHKQVFFPPEWPNDRPMHLDPPNKEREMTVRKLLDLNRAAETQMDAFVDGDHRPRFMLARNVPARLQPSVAPATEVAARRRPGRPIGSKNKSPRTTQADANIQIMTTPEEPQNPLTTVQISATPQNPSDLEPTIRNEEVFVHFSVVDMPIYRLDRKSIHIDDCFCFHIASIVSSNDQDPRTLDEARKSEEWPRWKDAMKTELDSLKKRQVFGVVQETPRGFNPVGYKWVFVKKRNDRGDIMRFKARLVAQGFSQRYGVDYIDTYSPVMDHVTFRYLINFAVHHQLRMHLVDVVTAYLYGNIDQELYMKVPEGFDELKASTKSIRSPSMLSVLLKTNLRSKISAVPRFA
ncbi:hypothetical protein R1sor_001060 [Riccia sorocarpa]|uniref:Uncharacterized protein n=1 Tax=Riccia sorocarpa TaxID=122646 RepID=A0ABD3GV70_9MARC